MKSTWKKTNVSMLLIQAIIAPDDERSKSESEMLIFEIGHKLSRGFFKVWAQNKCNTLKWVQIFH